MAGPDKADHERETDEPMAAHASPARRRWRSKDPHLRLWISSSAAWGPHGHLADAIDTAHSEFTARHSRPAGHGLRSGGRVGEDHRAVLQPPLVGEPEGEPGGVDILEQPLP
jgi:hypothetical protein